MRTKEESEMKDISLVRYSPYAGDHLLTAQLVECYRDVFADPPWHEWLKCQKCGKYWGTKDRALLASLKFRHCEMPLVDYWPRDQVVSDLEHDITPEASCWLGISNGAVIGFCWGYPITIPHLKEKLFQGRPDIPFEVELEKLAGVYPQVAYQDDMGIILPYRGRKIAKAMFVRRLGDFLAQGLKFGIARTRRHPEPSETFLWYTEKLGYRLIVSYPEADGRVVLGRSFDGLPALLSVIQE